MWPIGVKLAILTATVVSACVGCWPISPKSNSAAPTTYAASTSVDGYDIGVELIHNHEFLAEYRKIVTIRRGTEVVAVREYQDPGGLASFYIVRDGTRLRIFDGMSRGFDLDLKTGGATDISGGMNEVTTGFVGRFMFTATPTHDYRWVADTQPPQWHSGGGSSN